MRFLEIWNTSRLGKDGMRARREEGKERAGKRRKVWSMRDLGEWVILDLCLVLIYWGCWW